MDILLLWVDTWEALYGWKKVHHIKATIRQNALIITIVIHNEDKKLELLVPMSLIDFLDSDNNFKDISCNNYY